MLCTDIMYLHVYVAVILCTVLCVVLCECLYDLLTVELKCSKAKMEVVKNYYDPLGLHACMHLLIHGSGEWSEPT